MLSEDVKAAFEEKGIATTLHVTGIQNDAWSCGYISTFGQLEAHLLLAQGGDPRAVTADTVPPPAFKQLVWDILEVRDAQGSDDLHGIRELTELGIHELFRHVLERGVLDLKVFQKLLRPYISGLLSSSSSSPRGKDAPSSSSSPDSPALALQATAAVTVQRAARRFLRRRAFTVRRSHEVAAMILQSAARRFLFVRRLARKGGHSASDNGAGSMLPSRAVLVRPVETMNIGAKGGSGATKARRVKTFGGIMLDGKLGEMGMEVKSRDKSSDQYIGVPFKPVSKVNQNAIVEQCLVFYTAGEELKARELSLGEMVGFGGNKLPERFLDQAGVLLTNWETPPKKQQKPKSLRGSSSDDSTSLVCDNEDCVRRVLKSKQDAENSKKAWDAVCCLQHP
jgi:hypothetical protein